MEENPYRSPREIPDRPGQKSLKPGDGDALQALAYYLVFGTAIVVGIGAALSVASHFFAF